MLYKNKVNIKASPGNMKIMPERNFIIKLATSHKHNFYVMFVLCIFFMPFHILDLELKKLHSLPI